MDVIHVPGPPKAAFNKDRPMSDLIKAQIKHLKHLEDKLPASVRANLPQHMIVTESDAANYIAPMTRWLRSQGPAAASIVKPAKPARMPVPIRAAKPLAIAAAAAPPSTSSKSSTTRKPKVGPSSKGKKKT